MLNHSQASSYRAVLQRSRAVVSFFRAKKSDLSQHSRKLGAGQATGLRSLNTHSPHSPSSPLSYRPSLRAPAENTRVSYFDRTVSCRCAHHRPHAARRSSSSRVVCGARFASSVPRHYFSQLVDDPTGFIPAPTIEILPLRSTISLRRYPTRQYCFHFLKTEVREVARGLALQSDKSRP